MTQNKYLYKTFLAAFSLLMMSSCVETKIDEKNQSSDKLYFNATLDGKTIVSNLSRAYTADIDFSTRKFKVAGYRTKGAFSADNPYSLPIPNIFDYLKPGELPAVIEVSKDNTETNVNRQYWTTLPRLPLSNLYNLSFFAWASSLDNGITASTSSASDQGAPWLTAKVGAVNTPQPDIVGAASVNHSNEYTISAIDLDFKHLLSKMSFSIKGSNGMVAKITSIECVYAASTVYSEGKYTFDATAHIGSWGEFKTYIPAGTVATGWSTPTLTANPVPIGSMVFLPQNIVDRAVSLNIKYTITQNGSTSGEILRNIPIKAINLEQGKNYVYTLVANSDEIKTLNVAVEDWVDMPGIDGDLPIVPGAMDPNVMLLLEGTDAPYVTSDGRQFWLDRSGWNRHCQIMDKVQYSGANAFDITYNSETRGYYIPVANSSLYNHIKIPNLGTVNGNVAFEVVCQQEMGASADPHPFIITDYIQGYGESVIHQNAFAADVAYFSYSTYLRYGAQGNSTSYEGVEVNIKEFDYKPRAFYFGTRNTTTGQIMMGYNNTNVGTAVINTAYNGTKSFSGGYIGPRFKGTINYIKIYKKSLTFDDFMNNFGDVSKKYNVKAVPGPYAPKLEGLLACWDARSGLTQGASDGNGAYWMDQSGNGYYLRGYVPQGTTPKASITYDNTRKAMVFAGPTYTNAGTYMLSPKSMGDVKNLTFEMVYQAVNPNIPYSLQIFDYKGGSLIAHFRSNTGGYPNNLLNINSTAVGVDLFYDAGAAAHNRRTLTAIIDGISGKLSIYGNGILLKEGYGRPITKDMTLGYIVFANSGSLNQAFTGDIHAFRIYNRALTASEIANNYAKDRADFNLP